MDDSASGKMVKFNLDELLEGLPPRTNFNVAYLDDAYAIRVAKIRGTFPRHFHSNGDEGWFVYKGRLRIDSDLGSIELGSGEGIVVPKDLQHSPTCLEEGTLVLIVNVKGFKTVPLDESELANSEYREIDLAGNAKGNE